MVVEVDVGQVIFIKVGGEEVQFFMDIVFVQYFGSGYSEVFGIVVVIYFLWCIGNICYKDIQVLIVIYIYQ